VEERGVVEVGDKLLHQAIFFRNRKMKDKYDAVIKRWRGPLISMHAYHSLFYMCSSSRYRLS